MCPQLSNHQKKRIRGADAETLGRLVDQEAYWTEEALLRILDRVETLAFDSPQEADAGSCHALRILDRIVEPPAELKALTLAVRGSSLRFLGRYQEALVCYEQALRTHDLNARGRCSVLKRQTAALILAGHEEEGLAAIEEALRLQPGDPTNLSVRSWARYVLGDYAGTLRDCRVILLNVDEFSNPRPFLTAAVNAALVLRFEGFPVDAELISQVRGAIARCRASIPKSGSSFYSLSLFRGFLYRAEALLAAQAGDHREAAKLLRRAMDKFSSRYPDDAFFTAVDLICAYVRSGQGRRAVNVCRLILELSEELPFKIQFEGLVMARYAVERGSLNEAQAVELRALLRRV